jgi:hypothetical protein
VRKVGIGILRAPLVVLWFAVLLCGTSVAPVLESLLKQVFGREPHQPPDSVCPFVVACGAWTVFLVCLLTGVILFPRQHQRSDGA